jgi:hypothetical protein
MPINFTSVVSIKQNGTETFMSPALIPAANTTTTTTTDGTTMFQMDGTNILLNSDVTFDYSEQHAVVDTTVLSPSGNASWLFPYSPQMSDGGSYIGINLSSVFTDNLEEYTIECQFMPLELRTGKVVSCRGWPKGFEFGTWRNTMGMEDFGIGIGTNFYCATETVGQWYHFVLQQEKVGTTYNCTFSINGTKYLYRSGSTPHSPLGGTWLDFGRPYHGPFPHEPIYGYISDIGVYKTAKYRVGN